MILETVERVDGLPADTLPPAGLLERFTAALTVELAKARIHSEDSDNWELRGSGILSDVGAKCGAYVIQLTPSHYVAVSHDVAWSYCDAERLVQRRHPSYAPLT